MTDQRKQIITIFFFAVFLFVLFQIGCVFSPFSAAFFWAGVIAFTFYPIHKFILSVLNGRPTAAASTSTVLIILIVLTPSLFILKTLIDQTIELYYDASRYVTQGGLDSLLEAIRSFQWIQALEAKVVASNLLKENLADLFLRMSQRLTDFATGQLTQLTKNAFLVSFNVFIMIFVLFFLFRNGEGIYRFVYDLVPLEEVDRETLSSKINATFAGVIRGQFLTSLIQGVLAGIVFFFLGFPASSFFGLATFLASLIPLTGASTVWVPMCAYLFLIHEMEKGILLLVFGIFVISLSDNILKPVFISEKTKIPVFLLFLGILGGLGAYGLTGAFLGPILITLLFALIEIYRERYH